MGCIYRRKKKLPDGSFIETGPYWIKYYQGGRPIAEPAHSAKKSDAEKLLKLREGAVASGLPISTAVEKTMVEELLDAVMLDYKVNDKAVRFASNAIDNHLRRYFAGRRASSIGTADVHKYVEFRRSASQGNRTYRGHLKEPKLIPIRPASNATINRELALLKHGYYLGWRHTPRKVASIPYIPLLSENNVRKGFFEHEQFLAMRRALPDYLRPVLAFAYYTGCRRGEILALLWDQVDLQERIVRLDPGTTKNDEPRLLPLTKELYQVLAMQRSIRDAKYPACRLVFFGESGEPIRCFRRSWETACQAAGLTNESGQANRLFHDLRRSGVRNLIRAGVPETVAMRISGHKTRSVFDRYNIVSERDLKDAARKLEEYLAERKEEGDGYNLVTVDGKTGDPDAAKLLV